MKPDLEKERDLLRNDYVTTFAAALFIAGQPIAVALAETLPEVDAMAEVAVD